VEPRLVLDPSVRRRGETLVGGAPRRALRLSPAGWRALDMLGAGRDAPAPARALGRRLLAAGMLHPRPERRPPHGAVTVVIPVKDRAGELEHCLSALAPGSDVLVVDDGSADPGAIAGVAARHGARLLRRAAAGGPAAGRNAALAEPTCELIAFLDSDVIAAPGWLEGLIGHFDDPAVGAVAPRVCPAPPRRRRVLDRYLAARSPLDLGRREAPVVPGGRVSYVPSAALVVRRRALEDGFDERLRYGEDVDLVWRLHDRGWHVRYVPAVTVRHREPERLAVVLRRRFHYGTSAGRLARRHPGRLAPARMAPGPAVTLALLLARRPGPAGMLAAHQTMALARRLRPLGVPARWAGRWYGEALYDTGLSGLRYAHTFALPLAAAAAWRARRPAALALLAVPVLDEWVRRRPDLDPLRFAGLALADDAAYGAGVLWGCLAAGVGGPLLPAVRRAHATDLQPTPS
jgi:mycofactocin system glycosyltransferase